MYFLRTRYVSIIIITCIILVAPSIVDETFAFGYTVNQVQTITVGSTTSTSPSQQIVNRAFKVVSTAGTTLQCQLYNITFLGNQGQFVSGNFTSDIPLNFYIVPAQIFQGWLGAENCGNVEDAIASQLNTTTYSFNAALTSPGQWDFVFANSSNRDADIFMVAYLSSIGYTVTQPILSTTTSTFTSRTTTPAAVQTFPVESITIIALIGVVALAVVIVLIALGYRRRQEG